MAQRAFKPSQAQRDQVKMLTGYGFTQDELCLLVIDPYTQQPISQPTLRKHFKKEIAIGVLYVNALVAQSLFAKAVGDGPQSVSAAIFWLKARRRWREVDRLELTGADGVPLGQDAETVMGKLLPESVEERARKAIEKASA